MTKWLSNQAEWEKGKWNGKTITMTGRMTSAASKSRKGRLKWQILRNERLESKNKKLKLSKWEMAE